MNNREREIETKKKKKEVEIGCEVIRVGESKNGFGLVKKVLNKFVLRDN